MIPDIASVLKCSIGKPPGHSWTLRSDRNGRPSTNGSGPSMHRKQLARMLLEHLRESEGIHSVFSEVDSCYLRWSEGSTCREVNIGLVDFLAQKCLSIAMITCGGQDLTALGNNTSQGKNT
jgi:hypothetical protein